MLSVKGISVGIEDLQVYCIYYKQNIFYLHELFETGILIYYPAVFLWFFFSSHSASWKSVCDSVPSHSSCSSCGWARCKSSFLTDW